MADKRGHGDLQYICCKADAVTAEHSVSNRMGYTFCTHGYQCGENIHVAAIEGENKGPANILPAACF